MLSSFQKILSFSSFETWFWRWPGYGYFSDCIFKLWFAYLSCLQTSFQQICSPSGAHDSAKGSWVFLWSKGRLGLITWPFFVPVFRFNGRWDLFGVCSVLFLENFFFKFEDDFGYLDTWAKNRSNLRPMQGQFDANLRPIRGQRASSLLDLRMFLSTLSRSRLGQVQVQFKTNARPIWGQFEATVLFLFLDIFSFLFNSVRLPPYLFSCRLRWIKLDQNTRSSWVSSWYLRL